MYFDEKEKLNDLLLYEESYWKRIAKTFWLEEGDTNSSFFSRNCFQQEKINFISVLKSDDGTLITDHKDLCSLLRRYYTNVFTGVIGRTRYPNNDNGVRITNAQNEMLIEYLTFEEFTEAVRNMHPDKTSGPNGLNPTFFQHIWKLISREIFRRCRNWLDEGQFSPNVNDSTLVLLFLKNKMLKR